jgi:beta-fructofuranosidase
VYYGFYATRRRDRTQHLSLATSTDGVHFTKAQPNPLASPPPGYNPYHYRDPFVFQDDQTGRFHMLVTAWLDDYPLPDLGGCLAHLVSPDMLHWENQAPFLIPGYPGAPECADYFAWNGWYYLLFSNGLVTRYRMARQPFGPWIRPAVDVLDAPLARVLKTAPFTGNRRIGVAWLGTREGDRDEGRFQWGGHTLFRELVQHDDGTLETRFVPEMAPVYAAPLPLNLTSFTPGITGEPGRLHLAGDEGLAVAALSPMPRCARLTMRIVPGAGVGTFGLRLRGGGRFETGYDLRFSPHECKVDLFDTSIGAVEGLDRPFDLEVRLQDDIIDVCIDRRRCIVNRCPEHHGDQLFVFCHNGRVTVEDLVVWGENADLPTKLVECFAAHSE